MRFFLKQHEKLLSGITLCLSIILIWLWVYARTSLISWQIPQEYGGDAWPIMAIAKAFMDGDVYPVWYKLVGHLNAPFIANWNDFPLIEEVIFAIMGWLARIVGIFPAANFMVMLAHLLSGISFWYVGRKLKYRSAFVFSGAILFAFPHYIFVRSLVHLNLAYYWLQPLMLLVTWWTYSSRSIEIRSRKWWAAIAIAALTGVFSVYYTGMFLQFIGFAVLLHLARKRYYLIKFPLLLICVTISAFLIVNADTLSYALLHGANYQAVTRYFADLELYALKIPELIFPPVYHRWPFWADYGQRHYFQVTLFKGELGSPYLGFIGLFGLTWLAGIAFYRILQGKFRLIPVHTWQTLWVLMFSIVGGINLLLGTFGFVLFRGTNRYSIVILTIVLLFLVRQLSRKCPAKMTLPVAVAITVLGLWDQLPPKVSAGQIQQIADRVETDRNFSKELESQLPQNGMVFQLPVVDYPEAPRIYQMSDYEHFRPYLFTKHLHYSYGTNKGRGDADWQKKLSGLDTADFINKLEDYGFVAIMVNRKGYEDNGARLIHGFTNENRPVIADYRDLIAFRLNPSSSPKLPVIEPYQFVFESGFYETEYSGTNPWRWAKEDAMLAISPSYLPEGYSHAKHSRKIEIRFDVESFGSRSVWMEVDGAKTLILNVGQLRNAVKHTLIEGEGGRRAKIHFTTDRSAQLPGNGDPRPLAFRLFNLEMTQLP